jgi:hypothetical protein
MRFFRKTLKVKIGLLYPSLGIKKAGFKTGFSIYFFAI